MEIKKTFSRIVIFMITMFTALAIAITSNAATETSLYLGLEEYRNSNLAYKSEERIMWKITSYDTDGSNPNKNRTIYCIKAGPGFGSSTSMGDGSVIKRNYTVSFNLKDYDAIGTVDGGIYQAVLPSNVTDSTNTDTVNYYNSLVWVLEHCYVPAKNSSETELAAKYRNELLTAAGIANSSISDDEIDIAQQLAVWYFTNSDEYKITDETFSLWVKSISDEDYQALGDKFTDGDYRNDDAIELFIYLVENGRAAGSTAPVATQTSSTIQIISNNTTISKSGSNYVVGPYKLETDISEYTLSATLKDSTGTTNLTYSLLDSSKQPTSLTLKDLELANAQFYLSIPDTQDIEGAKFNVSMYNYQTTLTYWSVAGANAIDQPVVEIERTENNASDYIELPDYKFDLALRKFIVQINGEDVETSREPVVSAETISKLKSESIHTVTKEHTKDPLLVERGDTVLYTIRIYNEGNIDGYAKEITDYLPSGLTLKENSDINTENGWTNPSGDGKTIVTTKLSNKLLKAFDGTTVDYADVQVECTVTAQVTEENVSLKNVAEITADSDKDGNEVDDIDSTPKNLTDSQKENYNPGESEKGWGYEDDDDYEELILPGRYFDLALRKFIVQINGEDVETSREPVVSAETISNLAAGKIHTATKEHTKTPLSVETGDTVLYTIRIYNEGELDGYAKEITDYLPSGLTLKENSDINTENGWTNPSGDGKTIVTTKLADRLLKAFDGTTLDYADVQIECTVTAQVTEENINLKNVAEITADSDEDGNEVDDIDSTPKNLTDNQKENYNPGESEKGWGYEDDDDYEELILPGRYFDLALRKFIVQINGEDVETSREPVVSAETKSNLAAGKIHTVTKEHTKTPLSVETGDTVLYTIRIYNEGFLDGYAKEITDYLPSGLTLKENSDINTENGWTNPSGDGKTIVTTKLADRLLKAFDGTTVDYADVQVECTVTAKATDENISLKNIAEITADSDKDGNEIDDIDSIPENLEDSQKENYNPGESEKGWGYEDDDDYEELILPGKYFDLALRKFITSVNGKELINETTGKYTREPNIDVTDLANDVTVTTADYNHQKDPVGVRVGDIVIYTLRIYNEGDLDGYASSVTDYLPPQLEFVTDDEENFNASYGWVIDSTLRKATTTKLARTTIDPEENLIKAFDKDTMTEPDYVELKIKCRVKSTAKLYEVITNIAEITDFTDAYGDAIKDIDSSEDNVTLPTDENLPDYKGNTSNKSILTDKTYHYKGQQDDDDFEKLIIEEFDLALRKFITGVNDEPVTNRVPVFTKVIDENGNYIYEHTKEPIEVETTDIVEYTIRIYNEGNIAGYAKEVKDNIPSGLEFLPEDETNIEYRWKMLDENGNETTNVNDAKYITTDYLSKEQENETGRNNLLKAFNKDTMSSPDYRDVKVSFKVVASNTYDGIITNIAEISDDSDENGDEVDDIDSTPDNDEEKEDDIDVEHIKLSYFDLALRKFITAVDDTEVTNRYPVFKIDDEGNYVYEHTKEPVEVENGNIVTYTLRIYNEGTKDGYAKEIKDDLPEGLEFLPENEINKEYRWVMIDENGEVTENIEEAVSIKTDYLSKEQEDETGRDNLLNSFDKETMDEPDYRDIKIAFKVTEPNTSDRILINKAQILDDSDKDGNEVVDKDSTPDKWIEGEDDQDIEKVKVKYFDLALRKWVTQAIVIQDGKETVTETGHKAEDDPEEVVKVEIVESKLSKVVVKFRYKIRVINEGEIAGYVDEISDYIPEGLRFVAADNPLWEEVDGKVVTDQLKDTLLQPGESAEVEILLTWINGKDNLGLKVNVAEISKDRNDSDTPDIDSTPDNQVPGEDDIDEAPVILIIKTGSGIDTQYIMLAIGCLTILSTGIIFIKKYVL